jgi:hypothetical protein
MDASGFSFAISEKSLVKDVADTVGTLAPALELEVEDGVPLLPHAAATRATVLTPAVTTSFLAIRFN